MTDRFDERRNPWTRRAVATKYANPWIVVEEHDVLTPKGKPGIYGVVRPRALAIGVLPLDARGGTTLVGQYRYPLDRYSWEMPEGGGDKSVPPVESARRELLEETGLVAGSWLEVLHMDLSNSISDEHATCFVAWDLEQRVAEPEDTEELRLRHLPLSALVDLVIDGAITDSLTVATVLKLLALARSERLPDELAAIVARGLTGT
ncbi:MAG: NUDIX hydrolase [Alphaproteobacteria bacterium]|nr:NUDIX hydrolase [Alphaproteobacteria bacterium]